MRTQAVLFDLDGLLIDSEPLNLKSLNRILAPFGHAVAFEEYTQVIGIDNRTYAQTFIDRFHLPYEVPQYLAIHLQNIMEIMTAELEARPGAVEFLDAMQAAGLPIAVASNSPVRYVEHALRTIHLYERFDCVVSADQIRHPKPHPEIYQYTAGRLGVAPQDCLVLEDSLIGLRAATAAGARCIIIPSQPVTDQDVAGAAARFDSFLMLNKAIQNGRRAELL
ncbi:MAG: HAD family phosphatase [Anaerolineaceae bacterium]|jgi:HAD superfamily hydrolase (TIGR01509 family)|nr:HAD family phosphatase [Anaerolineaceae bacterium]